jgi:hypothetical protein
MHVCALGNVIGRTCREYAAGAVHHVRIANFSFGSKNGGCLGQCPRLPTGLLDPDERTRGDAGAIRNLVCVLRNGLPITAELLACVATQGRRATLPPLRRSALRGPRNEARE